MANDVLIVLGLAAVISATRVISDRFDSVERCDVLCATAFADSKASFYYRSDYSSGHRNNGSRIYIRLPEL